MTPARAQAISIVEHFPEEHISILVRNLLSLQAAYEDYEEKLDRTEAAEALQNIKNFRDENIERSKSACQRFLSYAKPGIGSGDYKKDLMEMLEKKYASID